MKKGKVIKNEKGLKIIELNGKPFEIGYQHGSLLKEEIRWFEKNARKILLQQEGKLAGKIGFSLVKYFTKKLEKFIPESFKEELKGIAKGADVDYQFLLLENFIEEISALYHWYLKPFLSPSFLRCSCFVVKQDTELIWGRNLDYWFFSEKLPSLTTLFIYHPHNNFPFVTLGWPGNIGAFTAISKHFGLALLNSPLKIKRWKGLPDEIFTRQIIQENKSLEEATENIVPGILPLGRNLVLVAKHGANVVELTPSKKAVRFLSQDGYLFVTNHFQTKNLQKEQVHTFPKPKKTSIPDEFFTLEGSKKRAEKLKNLCLEKPLDVERAKEILHQVSTPGTVQSIIALPSQEEFWIAKHPFPPVTEGKWEKFSLREFF